MSKLIKITPEWLEELSQDFQKAIDKIKMSDGKFTFTKSFGSIDRKATLFFKESAYVKMLSLVHKFDTEVAWHGLAVRGEDPEKDEYVIEDILVYPQKVTGANVGTDQEEYEKWLFSPEVISVIKKLRMQGHSHVNMGVSPSGTDENQFKTFLELVPEDSFYILLIWNKKGDKTIRIYDMAKNVMFETADVTVKILDEGFGFEAFMENARSMVKAYSYAATTTAKKDESKKDEPAKKTETKEAKVSPAEFVKSFDGGSKKKKSSYDGGYEYGYDWDDRDWFGSYGYYNRGGFYSR